MTDSPELAGQKLLDSLPDGCELITSTRPERDAWKATAQIINPGDSVRPVYLGRGATEDDALLRALDHCADYWHRREHRMGCNRG